MKVSKFKSKYFFYILFFFLGCISSYLTLQFQYFDIKLELDVPNILLTIVGIFVGLIVADSVQRSVNKAQNRYSYLLQKIDTLWTQFNSFCRTIQKSRKVSSSQLHSLNSEIIYDIEFLKQLFNVYDIDCECLNDLDDSLCKLEDFLSNQDATENIIDISSIKVDLNRLFNTIDKCFVKVMKTVE